MELGKDEEKKSAMTNGKETTAMFTVDFIVGTYHGPQLSFHRLQLYPSF